MAYDTSQWMGSSPNYYGNAVGYVNPYTPAGANAVENSYFDVLLKQTQDNAERQRQVAQQSHDTLVKQMKESRQLFNEDLSRSYGEKLQKANESAYSRGVGNSGIQTNAVNTTTNEKNFQVKNQDLLDKQKQEIADQSLQNQLSSIAASEASSRASFKSPYANYSY